MAVISNQTISRNWSGKTDLEGNTSYTVTEHVVTDNPKDGPVVVQNYFEAIIRRIGSPYLVGNDIDIAAELTSLDCQQIDPVNWNVVATYSSPKGDSKKDKDDNPEKDPRLWVDEITCSTATYQIPVRKAIYMGQWSAFAPVINRAAQFMPGMLIWPGAPNQRARHFRNQPQGVTNSAGTLFDPALMKDVNTTVIRITRTSDKYDARAALRFVNTLNKKLIKIRRLGLRVNIQPETAKMVSITGTRKLYGRIRYWEMTFEFHIDEAGWYVDIVDRGPADAKNAIPGNTRMAYQPYHPNNAGLAAGVNPSPAPTRVLVDDIGHPVRDPVLLDGKGGVLDDAEPEVYLRYGVYHSRDWTPLNLDFDTGPDWLPWIADIVVGDANEAQRALIEFEG